MNLSEGMLQIFTLVRVMRTHKIMQTKSRDQFFDLHIIREACKENNFHNSYLDELTSLIHTFKLNVDNLEIYGYDPKEFKSVITENEYLEKHIIKRISECKQDLFAYQTYKLVYAGANTKNSFNCSGDGIIIALID